MELDQRSRELRKMIVKTLDAGGRGHIGASLSIVEILRVLYDDILKVDPKNPQWPDRDRCVLSKGHGCITLYVMLVEKGFIPESELWKFCKVDGILGGHPEHKVPGIEASTGSLGHGLSLSIGMALNARYEKADYRTFVILGDGECNEGSVWEAALCAAKHKLSNLTVLIDYNKHQSYSSTAEILDLEPFADKWRAFGFATREVDGHDVNALKSALLELPFESDKPNAIICHTVKGKGIRCAENNMKWHHVSKLSDEDISGLLKELEIA
ncbi:MAG: transketolase [Candidatus Omnitrophica bacterium]|nr:transketolase [Candidatus Omnitrophota bacterium]